VACEGNTLPLETVGGEEYLKGHTNVAISI
jgi:hypothetical protein